MLEELLLISKTLDPAIYKRREISPWPISMGPCALRNKAPGWLVVDPIALLRNSLWPFSIIILNI